MSTKNGKSNANSQLILPIDEKFDIRNSRICSLKTEEEWLTTQEAAAYLKISVPNLWNLTSNGHVP